MESRLREAILAATTCESCRGSGFRVGYFAGKLVGDKDPCEKCNGSKSSLTNAEIDKLVKAMTALMMDGATEAAEGERSAIVQWLLDCAGASAGREHRASRFVMRVFEQVAKGVEDGEHLK